MYQNSGLSQDVVANTTAPDGNLIYTDGVYFPTNWGPRHMLFPALGADPDRRKNYQVHKDGPRPPAINITGFPTTDCFVDYKDAPTGFLVNGTLPVDNDQSVHSLTDVPVFAQGPRQELFSGVYGNIDIFYGMAECLGLSQPSKGPNPKWRTKSTMPI